MAKSSTPARKTSSAPAAPASSPPKPAANKPVHTIRYRGCEAAIWRNQSDNGPFYSVTVRKSYRDKAQLWHDVQSFLASDLPLLAKAISDAHSWIAWQERREQAEPKKPGGQP